MRIYNQRGMLIIPTPPKRVYHENKNILQVKECFCQNGHNLICNRVTFNNFDGIYLRARNDEKEGFIGLSPVYGEKCRIALEVDLIKDEIYELFCPVCDVELPVYSICECGANIITLFLNPDGDYSDCIGICTRVDCYNSVVKNNGELLSLTAINSSTKRGGMTQSLLNLR